MIITAKFTSKCPTCSGDVTPNTKVEWSGVRGSPVRHLACARGIAPGIGIAKVAMPTGAPTRPARVAGRSTGRRTGCSCGSREDRYGDLIPSDRNCAHCEHDA